MRMQELMRRRTSKRQKGKRKSKRQSERKKKVKREKRKHVPCDAPQDETAGARGILRRGQGPGG